MISLEIFVRGMAMLKVIPGGKDLTEDDWRIYREALSEHLDDAQFVRCVKLALETCKFFPSIAELLEPVKEYGETQRETLDEQEAMSVLNRLLTDRSLRSYLPEGGEALSRAIVFARFPERVLKIIAAVGGVGRIDRADDKDLPFLRRDWLAAWKSESKSDNLSLALSEGSRRLLR